MTTEADCSSCGKSAARVNNVFWECSKVECPNRKRLTAAPPGCAFQPEELWLDNDDFEERDST